MQISDSSSMRHTSGGLPFKLQQKKGKKKKKKSETDRERKGGKKRVRMKKYFKSNFPKKRRMGKCITTKLNFFFDFSSLLIAYIRAWRLGRFSSETVGDRDDCAVGAPEVNTPASLCAGENQPLLLFLQVSRQQTKSTSATCLGVEKQDESNTCSVCWNAKSISFIQGKQRIFQKVTLRHHKPPVLFFCFFRIFAKFKIKSALLNVNLFTFIAVC